MLNVFTNLILTLIFLSKPLNIYIVEERYIMQLPVDIRYKRYEEWTDEEFQSIQEQVQQSPWHASYHIEPKTGLLNDPNGFAYFNGQFHLFYQNWPYGPAHGLKQWVHTTSNDLVTFQETGTKILPDHINDLQGAYSGSAIPMDDQLFIFYTGNTRDADWKRTPLQIGAWMDTQNHITKMDTVLITPPEDVTDHFRDPQIFRYNGQIYALIGAQNHNKKGFIKLYEAKHNNIQTWECIGDLDFKGKHSEYMIECPNLVFVDEHPILLYCPQGLDTKELDYKNIYPNTYRVFDSFDTKHAQLHGQGELELLDYGFEVYATQAFNAPDGNVYSISWIGLPDVDSPTDTYQYHGSMSLVKELKVKDGRLYQYPVDALKAYRCNETKLSEVRHTNNCYELEFNVSQTSQLVLFEHEGKGFTIDIDFESHQFTIDRSQVGQQYALDFGTSRSCTFEGDNLDVNVFVDASIIELFINKGEKVFTSRVFPSDVENGIQITKGNIDGTYFEIKSNGR